jgi:MFS family permease
LLFSVIAGVWVDRLRRRRIMVIADLLRGALLALLCAGAWFHLLTLPLLFCVGFTVTTASVFFDVAQSASVPSVVAADSLVEAYGKLEIARSAGRLGGPGLAGLVIQAFGQPFAIGCNAVSYFVSAWFLGSMRGIDPVPQTNHQRFGTAAGEGFRFLFQQPIVRALVMAVAITNFAWSAAVAVIILFAVRDMGLDQAAVGLGFTAQGCGMVVGAVLATPIQRWTGPGTALLFAGSIALIGPTVLASMSSTLALPMFVIGMFFSACGPLCFEVIDAALRQSIIPQGLRGRVEATSRWVAWGVLPVGSLVGGLLGQTLGLRGAIWFSAACHLLALLSIVLSPIPGLRALPARAAS